MLMKRTQVYIDLPTYQQAKAVADVSGLTLSELIRRSLSSRLKDEKKGNSLELLTGFSKRFKPMRGTPTDLSVNLDHYLYGTPKRKN